jgi:response regulator of citrate/malate metabolism
MYSAEQMGRGLQQQRFQQELTQYQVPTAQLQALQGYYTGQLGQVEAQRQREFEAQQAAKTKSITTRTNGAQEAAAQIRLH